MKNFIKLCSFSSFVYSFLFSPSAFAADRMNEKELAACITGIDPVAADVFSNLSVVKSTQHYDKLDNGGALGLRILALCETNTPVEKLPNWKKLQTQIKKLKGEVSIVSSDLPAILLCSSSTDQDEVMVAFRYDIIRKNDENEVVITSQYFDYHQKFGSIPLPRDLRVIPKEGSEISRNCQLINADGSLTDA